MCRPRQARFQPEELEPLAQPCSSGRFVFDGQNQWTNPNERGPEQFQHGNWQPCEFVPVKWARKLASLSPAHGDRGLISIFRGLNQDVPRSSMMTPDTWSKQNGWKETPEGSLIECRFRGRNISEQEKSSCSFNSAPRKTVIYLCALRCLHFRTDSTKGAWNMKATPSIQRSHQQLSCSTHKSWSFMPQGKQRHNQNLRL